MNFRNSSIIVIFVLFSIPMLAGATPNGQPAYLRFNQAGYLPEDRKLAIVFAVSKVSGGFVIIDQATQRIALKGQLRSVPAKSWGTAFGHFYELDFTALRKPGTYSVGLDGASPPKTILRIGSYPGYHEDLLFFMRQQRCGYNPFLDAACHLKDGRSFYAPFPDESFVDASGGWHDAGDQLKYLITASNASARMLLAYELLKPKFGDFVDELGRAGRPNGVPDVLDEAKWGLDWVHKLHPKHDQLFHQVADDRDHRGFKMPNNDNADYGWGANSYRPVYFADGEPQGLSEFKSRSTGVSNIAGRSAAAMAAAYRIWKQDLKDAAYAEKCLRAARSLYEMGKKQEGYQQGNSFGAPYRYNEDTWTDDMEYAAAELYKATKERSYLADAMRYAKLAATDTWMEIERSEMSAEKSEHYQKYPFTNVGHFALYPLVDKKTKQELAGYYRDGIEKVVARGMTNSYGIGVPFLWCSNNLVVAYVTQVHLYELMTGDRSYHDSMLAHRDWLFGKNPWGTSMFEGLPAGGEYPEDTHLPTTQLLKTTVRGGLVDGPIDASTYKGLIGIRLNQPDEFAAFQPRDVVYHDDVGDYSTNEPTMDGTADAILVAALFSDRKKPEAIATARSDSRFSYSHDGIIRGDAGAKKIALVFTADEFSEGVETIANTLKQHELKASFFLTGRFYRNRANRSKIDLLKNSGHYLGPHSDQHLLYATWEDRDKLLVTKDEFRRDLNDNLAAMRPFGIDRRDTPYFMPPFEWYNRTISEWARETGIQVINFTPGTRSHADYTTPSDKNYITSEKILESIKRHESTDANGLNGFILLSHAGVGPNRTDKFYDRLGELITWLKSKGYKPVRVDELLRSPEH